jgi:hypothetical protein
VGDGNYEFYQNGILLGSGATSWSTFNTATTNAAIGNWNHSTNRAWPGEIDYVYVWDRKLSAEEIYFVTTNPYFMFGSTGQVKLDIDRIRIRPNIVINDAPFWTGPIDNPVEHVLNHLKLDDNAASAVLEAEIGPDATWKNISDDSDRNTNTSGDSVQEIGRGRNLDTQDGAGYVKVVSGINTVHDNDYFKIGSALINFKPLFAFNDGADQRIFHNYAASGNYISVQYLSTDDKLESWLVHGSSGAQIQVDPAFTSDDELQRAMRYLLSWNNEKDLMLVAFDGEVVAVESGLGTPSTSHPSVAVGAQVSRGAPADIVIDEIKTFNEAILPFGAFFIGNGEGLLADIDNPHADLSWYFDGQAAAGKGGDNLATTKNPTNTGGQFVTTDAILGTNLWDSNGTGNVLTIADIAGDIIDYSEFFVAILFKLEADPATGAYLIDVRDADGSDRISAVFDASDNLDITYRSNSVDETITGDIVVDNDVWTWLVIRASDTGKLHAYINGKENGTAQDIANTWGGGTGLTWYFSEDYNGANGCDVKIQKIFMGKKQWTPEIWTAFYKPLHQPLVDLQ